MSDPNNIVLHEHRLVLMLPCKVGNTSVKHAVAEALGKSNKNLHRASTWNIATTRQVLELPRDWIIAGFTRHPYDRFASACSEKLLDKGEWRRTGHGGPVPLDRVADMLPFITDQHWRPMAEDLCIGNSLVPVHLVRMDRAGNGWGVFRGLVEQHCGLKLGDLPRLNVSKSSAVLSDYARMLVASHYDKDFDTFGYDRSRYG